MITERREYTRIQCAATSLLRFPDGSDLSGLTRDVSFGGAHVDCASPPESIQPSTRSSYVPCTLVLHPDGGDDSLPITLHCHLMYLEGLRAGLRFTGAEEADFTRFRTFLLDHAEDPEVLLEEMRVFPNPAFTRDLGLPAFGHWIRRLLHREQSEQRP